MIQKDKSSRPRNSGTPLSPQSKAIAGNKEIRVPAKTGRLSMTAPKHAKQYISMFIDTDNDYWTVIIINKEAISKTVLP